MLRERVGTDLRVSRGGEVSGVLSDQAVAFRLSLMHERIGVLAAEFPEQSRVNQELTERRSYESAENHGGDGIQDFASGFLSAQYKRHETDAGG